MAPINSVHYARAWLARARDRGGFSGRAAPGPANSARAAHAVSSFSAKQMASLGVLSGDAFRNSK